MATPKGSDRFLAALADLELAADQLTVDEALKSIDGSALEVFWRDWPQFSEWAGELWRRLDDDFAGPGTPAREADLDETGAGD
jgi:hypothetical protein